MGSIAILLAYSSNASYGAAGALVIVLLWVYYAAQILFLGAEFTQVYSRYYGSRIVPSENAIPLTKETKAQQGIKPEAVRKVRPTPAPWQERRKPALGSIGSLIVGLFLGMFYSFRRKRKI